MPYVLDSPISQGLAAATGVLAGAQQKKAQQYAVDRQSRLDREQAQEIAAQQALAQSNAQATQAYRSAQLSNEATRNADAAERTKNEKARLDLETAAAAERAKKDAAEDAVKAELAAKTGQANAFAAAMKLPPNWAKMSPEGKIAYLQVRYQHAQALPESPAKDHLLTSIHNQISSYQQPETAALNREGAMDRAVKAQQAAAARSDQAQAAAWGRMMQMIAAGQVRSEQQFNHEVALLGLREGYKREDEAGKPPKTAPQDARSKDQSEAQAAIAKGADRNAVIRHFAAKWNMPLDKAKGYFQ